MALTPDSSATPYLGAADLLLIRDWREVGALAYDDSTTQFAQPDVLAHPAVAKALRVASGRLEAAALRGGRYAAADLRALSGVSADFLQGVVAALAFHQLRARRGAPVEPLPDAAEAERLLADLASGAEVLAFAESEAAGLPKVSAMTRRDRAAIGLPSTVARAFGLRGCGPYRG